MLETLHLRNAQLRDPYVKLIVTALEDNSRLKELDLSRNQIGVVGAITIANALKKNKHLKNLNYLIINLEMMAQRRFSIC